MGAHSRGVYKTSGAHESSRRGEKYFWLRRVKRRAIYNVRVHCLTVFRFSFVVVYIIYSFILIIASFVFQVLGLYGGGTWGSVKTLLGAGVGGLGPFPCRENEPFWKMPHKGKTLRGLKNRTYM